MSLELLGAVEICPNQDLTAVFYGQVAAQGLLTHNLQPLQCVLQHTVLQHTVLQHTVQQHTVLQHTVRLFITISMLYLWYSESYRSYNGHHSLLNSRWVGSRMYFLLKDNNSPQNNESLGFK